MNTLTDTARAREAPSPACSPPAEHRAHGSDRMRRVVDGELAVLIDDQALGGAGRGIFFAAAGALSAYQVTIMALRGRGILSVAVDEDLAVRLGIPHMPRSQRIHGDEPTFLVSIEAAACLGTGISADDRALTIRVAGDPQATAESLATPGHIMPLLIRRPLGAASTLAEVAYALLQAETGRGVAAWCDILDDSGAVASAETCRALAAELRQPCFTCAELRARLGRLPR